MKIKRYNEDSILKFGKHVGNSVNEILNFAPDYIIWCINNLEHFCVSEEIMDVIKNEYTIFVGQSNKVIENNTRKLLEREAQNSYDDYEKPSYGRYAGTYAQDHERLSDDFIDSALDGFPDAYWNID